MRFPFSGHKDKQSENEIQEGTETKLKPHSVKKIDQSQRSLGRITLISECPQKLRENASADRNEIFSFVCGQNHREKSS